ncbi:D-alanyl-D-alanine carboxypeptidase family protein [Planomonospora venezuelensis]|uniref:D-alanyl-D-alanine carboxypeptidase (Penicillin-binding protein 5/6) n=1 Tax=Planomonospora venezuelensis TaxID=1999 RepID=A0A841D4F1_PLAVE|nr:serine hydrolase [Planomonospora venezuelensis]MBB5962346.1 D-alanyl-D-alanine carboxypeptidase (penicillin-binding protein 5/6) [Planomonospora venezuelensis]
MYTGGIRLTACAALACPALLAAGLAAPAHAVPAAAPRTLTGPSPAAAPFPSGAAGPSGPAAPAARREAPAVHARAGYLVDATTGVVHLGKRATVRMPVASLTKVMTAYVVRREARLTDVVRITAGDVGHARRNDATDASLRAGERLTVRDLLYGAMLPSGADATHALARVYGPGQAGFTAKMNAAARSLGLADTAYANADGLPRPRGGYSTAADQAKLAGIVLRDPVLRTVVSTRRYVLRKTGAHRAHTWTNTNELIGEVPGVLGVKTGYTRAAGYCLSFTADRAGHRLIGVLLGESRSARRFRTAERLLEWAAAEAAHGDGTDAGAGAGADTGAGADMGADMGMGMDDGAGTETGTDTGGDDAAEPGARVESAARTGGGPIRGTAAPVRGAGP